MTGPLAVLVVCGATRLVVVVGTRTVVVVVVEMVIEGVTEIEVITNIIALLIVGVLLVVAYVVWERFLELKLDAHSPAWWTPPPLMRISLWGRASGKLAVTLCLALLEYAGFQAFSFWVQLYYQDYEGLSPILTMVRLLPMFVTGCSCNVIVALVIGHIDVVLLVGKYLSLWVPVYVP